jgi:hypothetical protein
VTNPVSIVIIYDQNRTTANDIQKYMNKIHKDLQFKATEEVNNKISFLDLLISRNNNSLSIDIYTRGAQKVMQHIFFLIYNWFYQNFKYVTSLHKSLAT